MTGIRAGDPSGTATERPEERTFFAALHRALEEDPEPAVVLYSGGLDSSLLAYCLSHLGRPPRLATLGTPGAFDLAAAAEGARDLGLPWRAIPVDRAEVERLIASRDPALSVREPMRSVRLALALAIDRLEGPLAVCGQGADELFGGYDHFRGLGAEEATRRRFLDLHHLTHAEWPWASRRADSRAIRLRAPYLDWEVRRVALGLPAGVWFSEGPRKSWLREAARRHGLPRSLADRPKKAFQYGSGIARLLRGALSTRGAGTGPERPGTAREAAPRASR